jgi:hypothetical protein
MASLLIVESLQQPLKLRWQRGLLARQHRPQPATDFKYDFLAVPVIQVQSRSHCRLSRLRVWCMRSPVSGLSLQTGSADAPAGFRLVRPPLCSGLPLQLSPTGGKPHPFLVVGTEGSFGHAHASFSLLAIMCRQNAEADWLNGCHPFMGAQRVSSNIDLCQRGEGPVALGDRGRLDLPARARCSSRCGWWGHEIHCPYGHTARCRALYVICAAGIGTGTVQRVLMEQPRPFDVDAAKAALASQ